MKRYDLKRGEYGLHVNFMIKNVKGVGWKSVGFFSLCSEDLTNEYNAQKCYIFLQVLHYINTGEMGCSKFKSRYFVTIVDLVIK